jgi:hypothetical protein
VLILNRNRLVSDSGISNADVKKAICQLKENLISKGEASELFGNEKDSPSSDVEFSPMFFKRSATQFHFFCATFTMPSYTFF